jgi:hypothetical protein
MQGATVLQAQDRSVYLRARCSHTTKGLAGSGLVGPTEKHSHFSFLAYRPDGLYLGLF